jgi:single stranded DNA-binding protein
MMRRCAMSSIAKVTIVGHIGSASKNEVPNKDTGEVIVIINFSVAVNRQSKNGDATDWYECSLYNRKGFEVDWLTKGKQVMVEGQLSLETYTTKAGEKGVSPKVRVNDVVLLGKKE